jgi:hypothetical protein
LNTESAVLKQIGLDISNFDFGYILIAMAGILLVLIVIIILMLVQMKKIKKLSARLDKFLLGTEGNNLEDDLAKIYEDNKYLRQNADENREDIHKIYKKLEGTFQKMGLVKYDAFNQMGGQLSFSLALLDENNNGFIINSVHSTEGCYSYTKEIKAGECDISLGDEEAKALEIALYNK